MTFSSPAVLSEYFVQVEVVPSKYTGTPLPSEKIMPLTPCSAVNAAVGAKEFAAVTHAQAELSHVNSLFPTPTNNSFAAVVDGL